jgi:putative ABC transport system permease protein
LYAIFKTFQRKLFVCFDALRQNKLRTLLSLLGVTIGIFTIIAVFSAVDTLRNNLQKSVNKLGNNSVYVEKWPWVGAAIFPGGNICSARYPNCATLTNCARSQTAEALSYEISIDNRTIKYKQQYR